MTFVSWPLSLGLAQHSVPGRQPGRLCYQGEWLIQHLAPLCLLPLHSAVCLDRCLCRTWNDKPWSSFLTFQWWPFTFPISSFPLHLLYTDSISTSGSSTFTYFPCLSPTGFMAVPIQGGPCVQLFLCSPKSFQEPIRFLTAGKPCCAFPVWVHTSC